LESLDEIDKFLDKFNLPKLNLGDINNLNRSIMSKKIEVVIISPKKEKPGMRWT
jgi:hypothetical protein